MGLKINGSTSGSIEIDVPAVAGTDTSITIPATSGGEFIVSDSAGDVNIDSGTFFLDSSANSVGIGTTSPSDYDASARQLVVSGSGDAGITIVSGTSSGGNIYFADGTTGNEQYRGWITYSHNLDGLRFATTGTEKMRIAGGGQVYINTTSSSDFIDDGSKFYVRNSGQCMAVYNDTGSGWNVRHKATNNGGTFYFISFNAGSTGVGGITSNSTTTTYGTTSDYRLKENAEPITGAVDRLKQLNPCRFNFIAAPERTVDGFLAHEAQAVVPEAVTGTHNEVDDEGNPVYQNIDQSKLVPLLTAALQEAIGKIEALETANASQAATIAAFEARLTALEGGAA